jgi:hypothetical protein
MKGDKFMDKKNKKGIPHQADDKYLDLNITASVTDCTGLIPTPPLSEDEEESYTDLHNIPQVKNKVDNGLQHD